MRDLGFLFADALKAASENDGVVPADILAKVADDGWVVDRFERDVERVLAYA